jgi:hypothetical protein
MKEETVIKYFDIVLLSEKKDSFFDVYDSLVPKYMNASTKPEQKYFSDLKNEIIEFAIYEKYFKQFPNGSCELTKKGKSAKKKGGHLKNEEYIEKKELESKRLLVNNGNIIQGDNYGNQSFERTEVKKNKITHTTNPIKKPSIWERIKSFWVKFWWTFVIPLAIVLIGILVERLYPE